MELNNITELLYQKYSHALESARNRDFYTRVYKYLDHIYKTPELNNVLEQLEHDYALKHQKAHEKSSNLEEKREFYIKLRHYLVHSSLAVLYVDLYEPIREYYESDELDKDQDPVSLFLIYGPDSEQSHKWIKYNSIINKKNTRKEFKKYIKWYEQRIQFHKNTLQQFHLDFMTELQKSEEERKPSKTNIFSFDLYTGKVSFHKTQTQLSPGTKEYKILSILYGNAEHQASFLELIQSYNANIEEATKSQKNDLSQIIKSLKKKLEILPKGKTSNSDIIVNIKKYGYRLDLNQ